MALEFNIALSDYFFLGEDKLLSFTIYQAGTTLAQIAAGTAVPEDVTNYGLRWDLRVNVGDAAAVISKSTADATITITGAYNASQSLNTQRVVVTLLDTDTDDLRTLYPHTDTYRHALKRVDSGSETILSFGTVALQQAAAH